MASEATLGMLSGLGGALQEVGSDVFKKALADDIEQQREKRQEATQERKLQRERVRNATTYDPKQDTPFERDGVVMVQRRAIDGTVLDDALATEPQMQSFRLADQERRLKLEDLTSKSKINQFKLGRLETEAAQDDEMFAATLDGKRAQAEADRARAANPGGRRTSLDAEVDGPVALSDVAAALADEQEDLVKEYALTRSEALELSRQVLAAARREGKDPVDTFRRALPEFVARRDKGKKPAASKGLNLGG